MESGWRAREGGRGGEMGGLGMSLMDGFMDGWVVWTGM